jgi:hypothetical protein
MSKTIANWENLVLIGLYDAPKSGRPPIFTEDDENLIIKKIEEEPKTLKRLLMKLIKIPTKRHLPRRLRGY